MKKYSRLVVVLTALLICLAPVFGSVLTAKAAGPVTYYVKQSESNGEWRYQTGNAWDTATTSYDLESLKKSIKDGDLLVIDGNGRVDLAVNVALENLTIVHSTGAVIAAKSINNFYAINDTVSAISGDVTNAYVYDACLVNFNNNVKNLELLSEKNVNLFATVAAAGTVEHVKASGKEFMHFEFYNFEANTLLIKDGHLKTDESKYSKTPSAPAPVATPAPTPAATPAPATPSASAGEYDDVPKTGDVSVSPLWFLGIAMICMTGQYALKRK